MEYTVIIERGPNNLRAYVPDLPGCVATGNTLEETRRNIQSALRFHIEGMREAGEPIPPPTSTNLKVAV